MPTPRRWSRALPRLATQKAAIVGENRWLNAVDGLLRDRCGPYSTDVCARATTG